MATDEPTLSSRDIYAGQIIKLRVDTVETADGRQSTREIVEHGEVIAVIPVDADDNVLLVKQFRKPLEKELLEIPAGSIDPGEDAERAVVREMEEEIGFKPQTLQKLGGFYAAPGWATEYLHLYLATNLIPSRRYAEDTAGIEVVPVSLEKIPGMIATGGFEDAKSVAGLLLYLELRRQAED